MPLVHHKLEVAESLAGIAFGHKRVTERAVRIARYELAEADVLPDS